MFEQEKKEKKCLVSCFVMLLLSVISFADTLSPSADGYVFKQMEDVADPASGVMTGETSFNVGSWYRWAGMTWDDRGIVKFDISGLTADVDSAVLNLTNEGWAQGSYYHTLAVYSVSYSSGTELEVADYDSSVIGSGTSFGVDTHSTQTYTVDVTDMINIARAADADYIAFRLENASSTEGATYLVNFVSTSGTSAPNIEYTLVPEPATMTMVGIGITLLARKRRRLK